MVKLLFLHIGKTGGTSIRDQLERWYPDHYPVPNEMDTPSISYSHAYFDYQLARSKPLVMGHFDWSIVGGLKGYKVLTVVRDPVSRLFSQYHHYRLPDLLVSGWTKVVLQYIGTEIHSFDDFVRHPAVIDRYINYQARILSGRMWGRVFSDPIANLKKVDYLGVYPDIRGVMRKLAADIGRPLSLQRLNVGDYEDTVTPDTRDYILREHEWDVEVFESARQIIRQSDKNMVR